jgi:hypothetical protein
VDALIRLRFGNGEQHPFDAAEQIAGGNVEHAKRTFSGSHTTLTGCAGEP